MIEPDGDPKESTFATTVMILVAALLMTGLLWLLIDSNPFGPHGP
jgi:hypothetical protein